MGGVLFIDEAYYLYRPENERDYGQEAIEILLQVMENKRDDLVVILAGYADRMDKFFESNPGFRSRIAHHIDFPDYSDGELLQISPSDAGAAELPPERRRRAPCSPSYIAHRRTQPHFANARSIRNALDRARLRQANRLFERRAGPLDADATCPPSRPSDICGEPRLQRKAAGRNRQADDSQEMHRMTTDLIIAPSILSADFSRLGEEVGGGRRGRRRLDPSRRDGRPFRAQHHLRPAGHQGDPQAASAKVFDCHLMIAPGRPLSSRPSPMPAATSSPCMPRPARISTARCRRSARSARRPASRSTRRRRKASSNMCSTGSTSCC